MTNAQLPPEIVGHMAGLGGTNENMQTCHSCQRAVVYGLIAHTGMAYDYVQEGDLTNAEGHIEYAIRVLLEVAKHDMAGAIPQAADMDDEDWRIAMKAFVEARVGHYTDEGTGEIIFEPHGEEGEPIGIAG